jgi:hypothetical protein
MKVIKDEGISQSQQKFETECIMTINFRSSARERRLNSLSRINGLKFRHIATF